MTGRRAPTEQIPPVVTPALGVADAVEQAAADIDATRGARSLFGGGSNFPSAKFWLVASDAIFLVLAMGLARMLDGRLSDARPITESGNRLAITVCFLAVLAALAQQHTYKARYLALRRDEFARVIKGVALGVVGTIVIGYLFDFQVPTWLLWLLATGSVLICLNREFARRIFARLRNGGHMVRRAIVVGTNTEADELSVMLMSSKELGYDVVGLIDTATEDGQPMPWRTVLTSVERMAEQTNAGNIIIAASATNLDTAGYLTRKLTDAGIHVEMCMPLPDIDVTRLQLRPLGRFPVFYVEPVDRSGWRPMAKRVFDVVAAAMALLLVSPILAVAALAIKVTSPGPVVFRQKRVGRDGALFNVLKLRTMVVDAEARLDSLRELNEASGPVFKIRNDPRITRVGRILRKFSIDEFPQLWNVLRGEMSLVGPRPALPAEMETWTSDLHERLRVRPGITGMWQVNGRTDTSGSDYVRLDLYYVDNWSLLIDLIVMAKTVPAVISGRGAY